MRSARSRSPRAIRACTARRCTSGRPDLIGIDDLSRPWVGDPTEVRDDEVPLFWACGVTPQSVVLDAKPSLCITHAPGHMLVTDLENSSLAEH